MSDIKIRIIDQSDFKTLENICGEENMLNVPFVEITSTGFITDPCPKNRLL